MTILDSRTLVDRLGPWTDGPGPLHRRLANALQHAIRAGIIPAGTRLPGERPLATALALSRTTVVSAYDALRAEGLLESRIGSGTRVRAAPARAAAHRDRVHALAQSPMMNLLSIDDSTTVDFALGTPDPLAELPADLYTVDGELQRIALASRNYLPLGFPPLREAIARYYSARNVPTTPEHVLVTSGAQQAVHLVVSLLVQRGDRVAIETPAYFGALSALRLAGASLLGLDVGDQHVAVETLRQALRQRPRLAWLTPSFHNPTGALMPDSVRREVVALAREAGVALVEDGTLSDLALDGGPAPLPMAAFSPEDTVLTIGSMSKLLWAGLRVGWIRGPAACIQQLARLKSASDLGSPLLTQGVAVRLLNALELATILRRRQLLARRDLLIRLLGTHFPGWHFETARGGLFLWLRAPGVDMRRFAQCAARHGVALTPGSLFSVDDGHREYLRLPYLLEESHLELGVRRMAAAWREYGDSVDGSAGDRRAVA